MCHNSDKAHTIIKTGEKTMDYLILVNSFEPLPKGYEKRIKLKAFGGKLFETQTADALAALMNDAEKCKAPLKIISGYRSEDHQHMLWEKEISKEMGNGLDYRSAVAKVGRTLALPGASEHETGLAVDFALPGTDDVSFSFAKSAQAVWLEQNAHKYGFILRYPRLKEHITGIDFEPWHYRYVGTESAVMIKQNGICLEEFLNYYQDKYVNSTNKGI